MMAFRSSTLVPLIGGLALAAIGAGCTDDRDRLFERLDSGRTGVDFVNAVTEDDTLMNPLDFFYVYNGGGVGVGDVNNDGWPDLYFTGNQVENRLYLNRGDFRFEDVTAAADVAAAGAWSTGVALADVDQDGLLDVYVCAGGPTTGTRRANLLFVNQGADARGVPSFVEKAGPYGIADTGYSTQAAFFDYDRDGDVDLYVLNSAMVGDGRIGLRAGTTGGVGGSVDRLYRNNGDGTFSDVSDLAGIRHQGYGLGLAVGDVNMDGWPDVYAANDFISKDVLYVNNADGTFSNRSAQFLKHQSYSAMGVDLVDVNNDALLDLMVLDMLPKDPRRRRLTSNTEVLYEGEFQVGRNTLQLNNGVSPEGHVTFSEIGQLAGVAATDWSWAPLFADFDNDGDRDLFVTNGYGALVTHLDFERRRREAVFFETAEEHREAVLDAMRALPDFRTANLFFESEGNLKFTDRTGDWGPARPGLSNGAAVADLDRDGDLDLVTNNVNDEATLLRNGTSERGRYSALRVTLHGPAGNRTGLGAKVTLRHAGATQYHDHSPYRGYQSTVEPVVHFGLGADSTADSLEVLWLDGVSQLLTDVRADQLLEVRYDQADRERPGSDRSAPERPRLFREVSAESGLAYRHIEYNVADFAKTPLLPQKYSRNGPGLAVGDADGNGLDDVFVGTDPGRERRLFLQEAPGRFVERLLPMDIQYEDMGALFFDADGDGDQDLYVVSGGSAAPAYSAAYQDRLYLNDGHGEFREDSTALPEMTTSGSSAAAADYDGDGDLDLFVGGRVRPGSYPLPPRSYLLRNDSEGAQVRFADVTAVVAPDLSEVGLVTSALWTDFNGDEQVDLIVVGEWMPITPFKNEHGRFADVTEEAGMAATSGWWNSLAPGDFDRDGDIDYVAGNLGLNTRYRASPDEPVRVHADDFDRDGHLDPVLSHYLDGTSYPAHGRDEMIDQIVGMIRRFPSYSDYAEASFDDVFTSRELAGAHVKEAVRFETSYMENRGDGTFDVRTLPVRTQFAPIFGMRSGDYDGDGHLDLLMVGNSYAPDHETGRADAFVAAFLRGDGTGRFSYIPYTRSGFFADGDAKGLAEIATGDGASLLLVTRNGGPMMAFSPEQRDGRPLALQPMDRHAVLTFRDGSMRKEEFYYGSTYLSQSSRVLWIPEDVEEVHIAEADGRRRSP